MSAKAKIFSNVKHGQERGSLIVTSDSYIFQGENNGDVKAWRTSEFVNAQIGPGESESIVLHFVHISGSPERNVTISFGNHDELVAAAQYINQEIKGTRTANVELDIEAQGPSQTTYAQSGLPVAVGQPVPMVQATTVPPPTATTPNVPQTLPPLPHRFGRSSQHITCPYCRQQVQTRVTHEVTALTWLWGLLICAVGSLCLLCCLGLVPCMMPQFQETRHTCPNCSREVAAVKELE
jgi:LITAF-like zinc ribbon domain